MARKSSGKPRKPRIGSGERSAKLERSLAKQGIKNPEALAASIGRKKYGNARYAKLAATGRRRAQRRRK